MKQIEIDREEGKKWRFTGNNFHGESGLETADMSTFKQDPMGSLARESCQNSIDAKVDGKDCVEVTFQTFKIKSENIPNVDRLKQEIKSCHDYQTLPENVAALERMLNNVNKREIECLRISDYNTTGLGDVNKYGTGAFYLLTKGNGITNKTEGKGGSKGVGKFASFVVSDFNTVFYSTKNVKGEEGYIGISKLCSTIYDDETGERTDGTGYYGVNFQGDPINEQLNIEPGYTRTEPGTDIYILGFIETSTWKQEIITKVLDSFMAAIVNKQLVLNVDDIRVDNETLSEIIENPSLIISKQYSNIKSQYILLSDTENVSHEIIDMKEYGQAHLYLKQFNKEESALATNKCVMVRYPLMKITELKNLPQVPFSALCIIENNNLNKVLRKIENPQHTAWEINRLNDDPDTKAEVNRVKKDFIGKIEEYIRKVLAVSSNDTSDIEGAGDILPSFENFEGAGINNEVVITEQAKIVPKVKNIIKDQNVSDEDPDGKGEVPDFIDPNGEGNEQSIPEGNNDGSGGGLHSGDGTSGDNDGETEGIRIANLSGVKYTSIMPNRNNGVVIISFTPNTDAKNCELILKEVDDSGNAYPVELQKCNINGVTAIVKDNKVINFDLDNNKPYKIEIETDKKEYFASEVKISYESR